MNETKKNSKKALCSFQKDYKKRTKERSLPVHNCAKVGDSQEI
jgi:hypothetical protein